MAVISLAGSAVNPRALHLDRAMFRVAPRQLALITVILLLISALYVKFW
jgi:SSS family solute:Na+ symporter